MEPERVDDGMAGWVRSGQHRRHEHQGRAASQDEAGRGSAGPVLRARDERDPGHDVSLQLPGRPVARRQDEDRPDRRGQWSAGLLAGDAWPRGFEGVRGTTGQPGQEGGSYLVRVWARSEARERRVDELGFAGLQLLHVALDAFDEHRMRLDIRRLAFGGHGWLLA